MLSAFIYQKVKIKTLLTTESDSLSPFMIKQFRLSEIYTSW